jgi:hypothetical protein
MPDGVEVEGSGHTKVLVLHRWAMDRSVWDAARAESDRGRFTYAYVDFPGYGADRSSPPADGLDGMGRSAVAAAEELGSWKVEGDVLERPSLLVSSRPRCGTEGASHRFRRRGAPRHGRWASRRTRERSVEHVPGAAHGTCSL